jgi:intracellular sulfur oxidation DsrE/DsrF family protein
MDDTKLQANRRDFLGLAATAAVAGIGAMVPATGAVAAANGTSTDFTRWLDTIPGTYKQLYDMPEVNGGMGLVWSFAFFMTGAPAYGIPQSDLGVVLVLRHNALPLALNDSAWAKYNLGEMFKINDPDTGAPAVRNAFYRSPNALQVPIPDAVLEKLIARGVKVAVCGLAITVYSGMAAQKMGLKHEDVKKEWTDAVLPAIQIVPSGVVACNGAASRGCAYVFAG